MQKEIKTRYTKFAPIIVFAYNRADKLERLLQSLEKNQNIEEMELYIFVDIPDNKSRKDIYYNQEVIEFIKKYSEISECFRSIQVEVARKHKGLANSIISGVSQIIQRYGKVIVLEDDLEVSNDFLDYMQRGLSFYKNDKSVWAVGGYCPQMNILNRYKNDVFLAPRVESWGWGTWKDRWDRTDWQVTSYKKFERDIFGKAIFNLGGNDLTDMLKHQMEDKNFDSWAIRWCYQEFLERKYSIYPRESRVIHCGNDSRATHGGYISEQKLKENYKRCQFSFVKPDFRIIWNFRKANSLSFVKRLNKVIIKIWNKFFV